jgi:hypothetical protein
MRTPLRAAAARAAAPARVGTPDAIERQIREELLQLPGGMRLERGLHPLLVLVQLQVALREPLAQARGRLLPVAVAGAVGGELRVHIRCPFRRCE